MIFPRDTYPAPAPEPRWCLVHAFLALLLCLIAGNACRTPEALLPTDIAQAGSTTYEGQAVWGSRTGARGVAGELLVILGGDGSCFIQFSKPPFNLVTARALFETTTLRLGALLRRLLRFRAGAPRPSVVSRSVP